MDQAIIDSASRAVRTHEATALTYAADVSEFLEPKRRYLITWARWRLGCQPRHVVAAIEASTKGDPRPLARIGLVIRHG